MEERTIYDILWYLNRFPNEINATDDIILEFLKTDKESYQKSKEYLIKEGFIKQREDNKNNIAWTITATGNKEIDRLKREHQIENSLAFSKDEQLKDLTITYFNSQIKSIKTADKKMYIGIVIGAILSVGGNILLEMVKKKPKDKEEIIQVHFSTRQAAIDSVLIKVDTLKK